MKNNLPPLTERQARLLLWVSDVSVYCHDVKELKLINKTGTDTVSIYGPTNELIKEVTLTDYKQTLNFKEMTKAQIQDQTADKVFIQGVIETIHTQPQAEACRNLIKAFHNKHKQNAHDDAFYLYGMVAGVLIVLNK